MIDWAARGIAAVAILFGATLIEIPQWGDANLIEVVWLITGILMILVSLWALPKVIGDYFITQRIPGHYTVARTLLARGHVRREVIRFAQGGIVTFIGVYAVLQPPPVPGPALVSPFALVLTAGLILLGALTAVQSVLDSRQRAIAEQILVRHNGDDEQVD